MERTIFKEFAKFGIVGLILGYFLMQDYNDRKLSRTYAEKQILAFEQMNNQISMNRESITELQLRTSLTEKDVIYLDKRVGNFEN